LTRNRNIYDKNASEKELKIMNEIIDFLHNKYPTLLKAIKLEEDEK
jgi:hypothetical protein